MFSTDTVEPHLNGQLIPRIIGSCLPQVKTEAVNFGSKIKSLLWFFFCNWIVHLKEVSLVMMTSRSAVVKLKLLSMEQFKCVEFGQIFKLWRSCAVLVDSYVVY